MTKKHGHLVYFTLNDAGINVAEPLYKTRTTDKTQFVDTNSVHADMVARMLTGKPLNKVDDYR